MDTYKLDKLIPVILPTGIFVGTMGLVFLLSLFFVDYFIVGRVIEDKFESLMYFLPFLIIYSYLVFYGHQRFNYFAKDNFKKIFILLVMPALIGMWWAYKVNLKRNPSIQVNMNL